MEGSAHSLPPLPRGYADFIGAYPGEALSGLIEALSTPSAVGVRFNSRKMPIVPASFPKVEWCQIGVRLTSRPAFTMDPMIHQGCYYVQDPSSMYFRSLAGALAKQVKDGETVAYLDACAAPGGKTTAAIDALPDGSVVVANEFDRRRAAILKENIAKWGYPLVTVTQGDTGRFAASGCQFDIISADVPCSGEGMMRKDADARVQWSPQLVERCASLQRTIVANLWPALRPGGYFIYSTCTFNRAENEDNIRWIIDTLGAENIPISMLPDAPGVLPSISEGIEALRFMPHRVDGEGLFVAVLKKPCGDGSHTARQSKERNHRGGKGGKSSLIVAAAKAWLDPELDARIELSADDTVTAVFPTRLLPQAFWPSLSLGKVKGRDIIPSQQLALSGALRRGAFPEVEVDRATAISYLRREVIELPSGAPTGFVLLTYLGRPLGFVKNLGSRANNLYPQEWRILSSVGPEGLPPLPFVDETVGKMGNNM